MSKKPEHYSFRARSVARFVDRLQPGEYVIRLIMPPRHHGEPFSIKAEQINLTEKSTGAIKQT